MYICTRLSTLFVSPSSIPHCQRNSYIQLFFETPRTHILLHTHIHIRVSLLRGQSSLAQKIIHISIFVFLLRKYFNLCPDIISCCNSFLASLPHFLLLTTFPLFGTLRFSLVDQIFLSLLVLEYFFKRSIISVSKFHHRRKVLPKIARRMVNYLSSR